MFIQGLSGGIRDELAAGDQTISLESLVALASRLNNTMPESHKDKASRGAPPLFLLQPKDPPAAFWKDKQDFEIDSACTVAILVTSSRCVLNCQEDRLITVQGDIDEPDNPLMDSPAEPPLVATTPLTPSSSSGLQY